MKCVLVTVICGLCLGYSLADFQARGALKARDAEQFLKERAGSHIVLKNREITEEQREAALHQVHQQARSSERIIGGRALGLGATPYVATLVAVPGENDPEDYVFCPITLIKGGYGITAAECLISNNIVGYPVGVIAGVNNLTAAFSVSGNSTQFLDICSYALIWSNDTQNLEQGILVVDFPSMPVYGPTVQAVELPANNSVFTGNTCATSGWGSTTSGSNTFPQTLQTANVTVQNPTVCANAYTDFCNDSEICAGVSNSSAGICVGDAGAPLVCTVGGVQYLAGVGVERSANCSSTPSVYSNIAFYSDYLSWYLGFLDTLCICSELDYYY
jgi:trypsin